MVKKYVVGFWYTVYGSAIVEADNPSQAEQTLRCDLNDNGIEGTEHITFDRDIGTQDAKALPETKATEEPKF